jgi:hypothetical protein
MIMVSLRNPKARFCASVHPAAIITGTSEI